MIVQEHREKCYYRAKLYFKKGRIRIVTGIPVWDDDQYTVSLP
jgi:hypothetical protein